MSERMQRAIEYALIVAMSIMVIVCVFFTPADATPFVWVDTVNGDDSSATPTQPNTPVRTYERALEIIEANTTRLNTPVRTYERALEIIEADTTRLMGIKIKPGSAPPTFEQAERVFYGKSDIVRKVTRREIIAGHGELPDIERDESTSAGLAMVRQWVWETFIAPNGQLAERCIDIIYSVEDY